MDMTTKTLQPNETRNMDECSTESQDFSASDSSHQGIPDVYESTMIYNDDLNDRPEYDDVDDLEMVADVQWCDKDLKEEEYYDLEKMTHVWNKYNGTIYT